MNETKTYSPRPQWNSIPLMKQLAKMAGMENAGIKRMVLVLDCECLPTLYVESNLDANKMEPLIEDVPLAVKVNSPEIEAILESERELFESIRRRKANNGKPPSPA